MTRRHTAMLKDKARARETLIETRNTNPISNVSDMIEELKRRAAFTGEDVVNGILENTHETLPMLVHMTTTDECWHDYERYTWSPVCAIHLLAKINNPEARKAISESLIKYYDDTADWLTEDAPYILAYMGVDAVEMLTGIMRNNDAYAFVRGTAAGALIMIAIKHPEIMQDIITSITDTARGESDLMMRTILVDCLLDLREPDLYGYLKDAVKTGYISDDMYHISDLDAVYSGKSTHAHDVAPRDPLGIFAYKNDPKFAFYRRVND